MGKRKNGGDRYKSFNILVVEHTLQQAVIAIG